MLTDEQMRQAAIENPGRIITKHWNPNPKREKWVPMNFNPDNWRKLERSVTRRKPRLVKYGFDQIVPVDPPTGANIVVFPERDDRNYIPPRRRYEHF